MPILNYGNPLHTFSTDNLSYTATKECYIVGTLLNVDRQQASILTINNVDIARSSNGLYYTGAYTHPISIASNIQILKVKAGDVISVNIACPELHIFEEV